MKIRVTLVLTLTAVNVIMASCGPYQTPQQPIKETQTLSPGDLGHSEILLTYKSYSKANSGKQSILGIRLHCPEETPPCLGMPEEIFAWENELVDFPVGMYEWSPDGSHLAISLISNSKAPDVFIGIRGNMGIEELRNITNSPLVWDSCLSWYADNDFLLISNTTYGEGNTYLTEFKLVDSSGAEISKALSSISHLNFNCPDWSPINQIITFNVYQGLDADIYISDINGSSLTQLTNTEDIENISPVFSPDGNWIAFVRSDDNSGKSSIIKIRLDGSGETVVLTIENAKYLNLAWSPDGNWIAFSLRQNGDYDIYLIRPDGNDLVMVTNDSNIDRQPRWLVINEP
jgi:hypothetical protein